jgi:uncharacterized protein YyaL (SSP411 family)
VAEISWRDWSTESFTAAHRASAPVLLIIGARWSASCRRFEVEVLADPAVRDVVSRRFVALMADVDRRPDIAARYGLPEADAGGVTQPSIDGSGVDAVALPTVLCLTADGEVLSGGGAVEAPRLARALAGVADVVAAQRDDIDRRAREGRRARREALDHPPTMSPRGVSPGVSSVDVDTASAAAAEQVTRAFDEEWAGFGDGVKRPHTSAVAFALTCGVRTGDRALREIGVRTLDRLGWSALSDARTGAFHRLCRARDWSEPDTARLLGVQADLAGLLLDAAVILEEDACAERARAAIDYVIGALGDPAGGFFESEAEAVDRICVTASNARMVRTLLRAADVLRTPRYGELALLAIERLVPAVYAQGAGLAHYLELDAGRHDVRTVGPEAAAGKTATPPVPRVRGLLVDQVETSAALLDLAEASGNRVYLELAEELMRGCLRKLWRAESGGFLDRLRSPSGGGDLGRMGDPLIPFALNCLAARVLARLAHDTGHADLRAAALDTLSALAPAAADHGLLAADYALAALDVTTLARA